MLNRSQHKGLVSYSIHQYSRIQRKWRVLSVVKSWKVVGCPKHSGKLGSINFVLIGLRSAESWRTTLKSSRVLTLTIYTKPRLLNDELIINEQKDQFSDVVFFLWFLASGRWNCLCLNRKLDSSSKTVYVASWKCLEPQNLLKHDEIYVQICFFVDTESGLSSRLSTLNPMKELQHSCLHISFTVLYGKHIRICNQILGIRIVFRSIVCHFF